MAARLCELKGILDRQLLKTITDDIWTTENGHLSDARSDGRCAVNHCKTPRGTTLQPLLLLVLTWLSGLVPCLYVGANSVLYWAVIGLVLRTTVRRLGYYWEHLNAVCADWEHFKSRW